MTAKEIAGLIRSYRFSASTEAELQAGIAQVLTDNGIAFEKEKALGSNDRPDFMAGGTCIEVKVEGSWTALTRQIARYVKHDFVTEVLVVTTKASHSAVPSEIDGKPVVVVTLNWGGL